MLVLSTLQDKSQQQTSQQDRAGGREESKKQEGRETGKEGTHCQMFGRHVTCNPQFRKLETEKKNSDHGNTKCSISRGFCQFCCKSYSKMAAHHCLLRIKKKIETAFGFCLFCCWERAWGYFCLRKV